MKKIEIERTKKGYPAFWEVGGGFTNTGYSYIVANKDGQPKKAIFVRNRGHLANGEHALIPIAVGDLIINADHHRSNFKIFVYRITDFLEEEALVERIAKFSKGEWDTELPVYLEAAVQAAIKKATCYHCREPHFIMKEG